VLSWEKVAKSYHLKGHGGALILKMILYNLKWLEVDYYNLNVSDDFHSFYFAAVS
jgi:hypothetical protein